MKIDASRFVMFWANPERYRLREIWKIAPIEPKADTFAALLTYGRRRGTCTHEMLDGRYKGFPQSQTISELKDGGFGDKEIAAAQRLVAAVIERYPDEKYLAHEVLFEYSIPDSPHVMTGRIDHILEGTDTVVIGDWKGTKKRTKKDMAYLIENYKASPQVNFYLLGATTLGFNTLSFLYRVLEDRGVKAKPNVYEAPTDRTNLQLRRFARYVHMTCELIEWMTATYGVENPWPELVEPFDRGYGPIAGHKMFEGYMPDGYTEKTEHLETMMDLDDDGPEDEL